MEQYEQYGVEQYRVEQSGGSMPAGALGASAPVRIIPEGEVAFGIQLPVQSQSTIYVEDWEHAAGPAELARVARQAEDSGFFYVAVCDHTAIPRRLAPAMSTTWYDTIATLGWLAGVTTRVRLMSHVYIAAQRHPLRAAKEFATLDVLSGGRLVIGVGAGHVNEEFDVMGPPFEERGAALDEAIDALALALTEEFPTLPGPRWPASDLSVSPRPVQRPRPPIWVGGSSRAALRRAARRGDGWLPQTVRRSDMRDQVSQLLDMRQEMRGGAPIEIGALAGTFHVGEPARELPRGTVSGSPDRIAENLAELVDMGVSHVQMRFPNRSLDELCDQMAAFGEQVGPLLRR
ncbi:MAG TPA: TIGR03619 family F420-dependent LLM class oxidoreductase [Acidimicrobiales bacterium]|nr:TIGR03619 family F420-dependent LLM class oxidoreductase [Acidimicrobiales bacterium]